MNIKKIAVIVAASALAVAAFTTSAWAANGHVHRAVERVVAGEPLFAASSDTAPVAQATMTAASWRASADSSASIPATGTPLGWTVRVMAQMRHSGEASGSVESSGTPFGDAVRTMAQDRTRDRLKDGTCTTSTVAPAGATIMTQEQARHATSGTAPHMEQNSVTAGEAYGPGAGAGGMMGGNH